MINFDSFTLKLFCDENSDFFSGAKIQKIQQPSRSELIFYIRNKSETKKFYININPNFYHICFFNDSNEQKRSVIIPKVAPMFCMLLRKYILNAKIIKVNVPLYERIFEIYFEYYDELNEKSQLCLAIELMGKYSNIILYNFDTNVIIGCCHNVSSEKSRERELAGLLPYTYPAKQKKKNLLNTNFKDFMKDLDLSNIAKSISSNYYYLTIPMIEEFFNNIIPFDPEKLYSQLKKFLSDDYYKYYIKNDYSLYSLVYIDNSTKFETVNDLIDSYFAFHQHEFIKNNLKSKIIKLVNIRLKKLKNLEEKQNNQIKLFDTANVYKKNADIIMANLYNLKHFSKEINLTDFNGTNVNILMDENLSAIDNANKYYALYKKIKSSYEYARSMIEDTKSQIMFYEEQKFYVQYSNDVNMLQDLYSELKNENIVSDNLKQANSKLLKVDFIEYNGFKIFIGKNQKQNDYILSKLSSSEDLWFHPLNAAGSHVLLKVNSQKEIPNDVLLKAAILTKEYSSQKYNSKTSIIYTKRKYVKKANNKIAFVTYKNESEIIV